MSNKPHPSTASAVIAVASVTAAIVVLYLPLFLA
jgi:hypothetical protein